MIREKDKIVHYIESVKASTVRKRAGVRLLFECPLYKLICSNYAASTLAVCPRSLCSGLKYFVSLKRVTAYLMMEASV